MREIRKIICISVFLICVINSSSKSSLTELYKELNIELSKREYYIDLKQKKIAGYKIELSNANTIKEQYEWSKKLTDEYAYFNLDSVLHYSNKTIASALELKDEHAYYEALIEQAYILTWQGYFHEPIEILESIHVETLFPDLRPSYYLAYLMAYHFRQQRVMNAQYRVLYRTEALKYTNLYFTVVPVTVDKSVPYLIILAYKYYQLKDYKTAACVLTEALNKENITKRDTTNGLFIAYLSYSEMGKDFENDAESYLLQSAILGIETAKLSQISLIKIALLQNKKGNYSLALKYINASIANMEICQNTYFRTMAESARLLIEKDYNKQANKEQNILYYSTILILVLSVLTLGTLIYVQKKNRLLKAEQQAFLNDSEELILSNKKLSVSSHLKDSHIIHWLNTSSYYINKIDETKRLTIRKINTKQPTDILKSEIEALVDIKEERLKLYSDFDKIFYKTQPDFISKINALLQEDHYFFKNDLDTENTRVSTELRILALIKLGVNDNKQIASFLQFTIQSVYNYRSSIKSRALNPDTFEADFDKI